MQVASADEAGVADVGLGDATCERLEIAGEVESRRIEDSNKRDAEARYDANGANRVAWRALERKYYKLAIQSPLRVVNHQLGLARSWVGRRLLMSTDQGEQVQLQSKLTLVLLDEEHLGVEDVC